MAYFTEWKNISALVLVRHNDSKQKANKNHTGTSFVPQKILSNVMLSEKFRKFIYISHIIYIYFWSNSHRIGRAKEERKKFHPKNTKDDEQQKNIIFPYLNRARNQLKHLTQRYWNWNRMGLFVRCQQQFVLKMKIQRVQKSCSHRIRELSTRADTATHVHAHSAVLWAHIHTHSQCHKNNMSSEWLIFLFILWQSVISLQMLLWT